MSDSINPDLRVPNALLEGAMDQFKKHGFAKTSMSDIARASTLSRTSLYNHFETKEQIFRALSVRINEDILDSVARAMTAKGDWKTRITAVIHARVNWVYTLLHESEFGRELINEKNRLCGGQVLASNDRFHALIVELLGEGISADHDAHRLATLLLDSINGVLEKADSKDEAQDNVAMLVDLFCEGAA